MVQIEVVFATSQGWAEGGLEPCFGSPGLWRQEKKKPLTIGAWDRQQQLLL